jgi:hypothetical protein
MTVQHAEGHSALSTSANNRIEEGSWGCKTGARRHKRRRRSLPKEARCPACSRRPTRSSQASPAECTWMAHGNSQPSRPGPGLGGGWPAWDMASDRSAGPQSGQSDGRLAARLSRNSALMALYVACKARAGAGGCCRQPATSASAQRR